MCNEKTLDKAFLINLASLVGMISKVGGLTKFADIQDEITLMVRRLVQNGLYLTKRGDFAIIDMLNSSIYSRV